MTHQDQKLREIRAAIAHLERAEEKRMSELEQPKKYKVRNLWESVQWAIYELKEAGEDPVALDADTLHITGRTFSLSASGELIEH